VSRMLLLGIVVTFVCRLGQAANAQIGNTAEAVSPIQLEWSQLPPLPDPIGLAGPFVGVVGDALVVAGGANFPEAAPWEGGAKTWHDRVFVLPDPDGKWLEAGRLPRPLAYGVSVSWRDRMILIGGGDATRHSTAVTELRWDGRRLAISELPRLPKPCAFMTGVLQGDSIFIAGGIETPDSANALTSLWSLDLVAEPAARTWKVLPPLKTGRILGQSAIVDGRVLVAGGADLSRDGDGKVQREFLKDAWLFNPDQARWDRAADLPRSIVAAPGPGISAGPSTVIFLSGDDGRFFGQDLQYQHPGFPAETFAYDAGSNRWSQATRFPKTVPQDTGPLHNLGTWPPVTTGVVRWRDRFVIASGEIRPAVRSPNVFSLRLKVE
jgi:N-acetylneuraminic acid mutarotase